MKSHAKCYLRGSHNCSDDASREHYISRTILNQIGSAVEVEGVPWLAEGEAKRYPTSALTATVLCARHNNALSPLDAEAGRFFRCLGEALDHVQRRSLSRKTQHYLVSGEALERWAVKSMLGLYHAKVARAEGKRLVETVGLDSEQAGELLMGATIIPPLGLYVRPAPEGEITRSANFAPLISNATKRLAGLRVAFHSLEFDFVFEALAIEGLRSELGHYRPTVLDLDGPARSGRIVLTWTRKPPATVTQVSIRLRRETVLAKE